MLWSRTINADEIPDLETMMIIESHWCEIENDFLYRCNRLRTDVVIWLLTSRTIP